MYMYIIYTYAVYIHRRDVRTGSSGSFASSTGRRARRMFHKFQRTTEVARSLSHPMRTESEERRASNFEGFATGLVTRIHL